MKFSFFCPIQFLLSFSVQTYHEVFSTMNFFKKYRQKLLNLFQNNSHINFVPWSNAFLSLKPHLLFLKTVSYCSPLASELIQKNFDIKSLFTPPLQIGHILVVEKNISKHRQSWHSRNLPSILSTRLLFTLPSQAPLIEKALTSTLVLSTFFLPFQ